jgi:hypothetical protein
MQVPFAFANSAFHTLSLEALANWVWASNVVVATNVVFSISNSSFHSESRLAMAGVDREKGWQDHDGGGWNCVGVCEFLLQKENQHENELNPQFRQTSS